MLKLGIITHHEVHNHGAVLQLYALEQVLKSMSCEAKALCYKKSYDFLEDYAENKYNISLKSIPYYIGYLIRYGLKRTWFNFRKKDALQS